MRVILQAGRATDASTYTITMTEPMATWMTGRFAKICVGVESEAALDEIMEKARAAGLPCAVIVDAGRTEFHGVPTKTCCAIGPAYADEIDPITGALTLL
jgi:PTH2 family peptidyl-tRNA hydrolase